MMTIAHNTAYPHPFTRSAVPLSRAVLKANPALHSALLQFETSQLKLERAFVTPLPHPSSSSSSSGDDMGALSSAAAGKRRASLYSQDSDDDSDSSDDSDSDGSDVWGDDEGLRWEDEEDDEEWLSRDVLAIDEVDADLARRGRSRSRGPHDHRSSSSGRDAREGFVAPPLPESFRLRIPEGRRWRNRTLSSSPLTPSLSPDLHHAGASSSGSEGEDDDAKTLYDGEEARSNETAVDVDAVWQRAMRFGGWIRRPSDDGVVTSTTIVAEHGVPEVEGEGEVRWRWEYQGRKDRRGAGGAEGVVEGLRRLVDLVQA